MKKFKTKKKLQKEIKKYLIQKEKLKKNSWKGEWSANGEIDKKVSETFGKHKLELTLKIYFKHLLHSFAVKLIFLTSNFSESFNSDSNFAFFQ